MTQIFCLIPARLGSKRLPLKNLRLLGGVPLLSRAIRKAFASRVFDSIWVSSESERLGTLARAEGAQFHRRPDALGSDDATSEDFVADFLEVHDCDWLVQLHSIAPLLTVEDTQTFVSFVQRNDEDSDAIFSVISSRLEMIRDGEPLNFSFDKKTNSQDLAPVHEICWALTAWKRSTFLHARAQGKCATYFGRRNFVPITSLSGHVIKTELDLELAEAILPIALSRGQLL